MQPPTEAEHLGSHLGHRAAPAVVDVDVLDPPADGMPAAMVQASASSSASSESVSRAVNLTRVCAEMSVAESMRAVAKRPLQGPLRGGPAPTE